MYVGNAFYMYVAQVLFGVTWVIHEDREHYKTLKQVYIAPINFYVYILGRSVIKIAITTAGVIITLAFGVLALGVDISLGDVDWLLLLGSTALGMSCICVLGLALGALTFLTARHSIGINEGVAVEATYQPSDLYTLAKRGERAGLKHFSPHDGGHLSLTN